MRRVRPVVVAFLALSAARASCREPARAPEPTVAEHGDESSAPPAESDAAVASVSDASHRSAAPREIEARHILVMFRGSARNPGVTRTHDEARARADEALRRARAGDDFAALVREFSDEPGAGARGGALGRFGHGMMTPAFERAAFALDVGAISDVVETEFGFHVIQRTE